MRDPIELGEDDGDVARMAEARALAVERSAYRAAGRAFGAVINRHRAALVGVTGERVAQVHRSLEQGGREPEPPPA